MDIKNKIFSGDCRSVMKDFPSNSVASLITDPPYNYEFIGHKWDDSEIKRRLERVNGESKTLVKNIPYGSGLAGGVRDARWYQKNRNNIVDYENWCYEWGVEAFRVCKPGALVAVFNSTRTMAHVQVALEKAGFYARDCIVYRRSSGIPKGLNFQAKLQQIGYEDPEKWDGWHSCLRNEWEAIVVLQKPLENNYLETVLKYGVGLFYAKGENGGFQSNILENIERDKNSSYNVHCTVKPLKLMMKLIKMLVPKDKNNIILDPFAGSGTTLVAAKQMGHNFAGIEIVPEYIDIIKKRLEELSGDLFSEEQEICLSFESKRIAGQSR